jgi:hypothetical protein
MSSYPYVFFDLRDLVVFSVLLVNVGSHFTFGYVVLRNVTNIVNYDN